jgi:predicted amidohydrolase YtcJ
MGLLLGLEGELTELVPRVSRPELDEALARVGRELAALGVVSVDEMTATNAADRVARLANAVEQGGIPQRVRAYVCDADEIEAAHRASRSLVEVVGVKRLAHSTDEVNAPEFGAAIDRARRAGAPVAVHAIEPDVVESVLSVFESAVPRAVGLLTSVRDRIEHCSLCPPELASRLARAGVGVVTHPAFLPARGERYVRQVESPLWPWLYPLHSLRRAGVVVAAGTDAPVGPLDPWLGFRGATERRAGSGIVLGEGERLSPREALELHTEAAWQLRGENRAAAWPCAGDRADLVLLEGDPRRARLDELEVCGTVIGGLIAHGCAA